MAGDERDELFEDLDKFFAPVDDVRWPEGETRAPAPAPEEPFTPPDADAILTGDEGDETEESAEADAFALADEGFPTFEGDEDVPSIDIRADEVGSGEVTDGPPADGGLFSFPEDALDAVPAPEPPLGLGPEVPTEPLSGARTLGATGGTEADDLPARGSILFDDGLDEPFEGRRSESPYVDLPPLFRGEVGDESRSGPLGTTPATSDEPVPSFGGIGRGADLGEGGFAMSRSGGDDFDEDYRSISRLLGEVEGDDGDASAGATGRITGSIEGLEGPSWHDASTIAIGAEPERRTGRNLPLALLTGVLLAGAALATILAGRQWFALLAGVGVALAQGEFYSAARKRLYRPATAVGLAGGALIMAAAYLRGEAAMLSMVGLSVIATYLWFMVVPGERRHDVVRDLGVTLFGIMAIPFLAGFLLVLLRAESGTAIVIATIGLTVAYDTAAFLTGYLWGRRPLAPSVSPKKSWEGAVGGTLLVIALSVGVVASWVPALGTVGAAAGLGIVVSILAPLGDLAESLVKRDLGLKDMGSILPGHGGILDRIDALLFVAPGALLYLRILAG